MRHVARFGSHRGNSGAGLPTISSARATEHATSRTLGVREREDSAFLSRSAADVNCGENVGGEVTTPDNVEVITMLDTPQPTARPCHALYNEKPRWLSAIAVTSRNNPAHDQGATLPDLAGNLRDQAGKDHTMLRVRLSTTAATGSLVNSRQAESLDLSHHAPPRRDDHPARRKLAVPFLRLLVAPTQPPFRQEAPKSSSFGGCLSSVTDEKDEV